MRAKTKVARAARAAAAVKQKRTNGEAGDADHASPSSSFNEAYSADAHREEGDVEAFAKLRAMIKDVEVAMLTTVDPDGALRSRPMATIQFESKGADAQTLWFFTGGHSGKVEALRESGRVNLAYSRPSDNRYVSVCGTAKVLHDGAKAEELWTPAMKAWFPEGLEDPELALIRVDVESAEYWDPPSRAIVQLIGFAKAILTGERWEPGGHGKIEVHARGSASH